MRRTTFTQRTLVALLVFFGTLNLRSQGVLEVPDKFHIQAGWQFTSIDTEVGLARTGALSAGITLNFEDTFAMPVHKEAWQINGSWRMADRHLLDFGYEKINRISEKTLDRDITWGDYQINASGKVQAHFDSDFPYLGYRYAFYEAGDLEMSIGGGISYLHLGVGLDASGTLITNTITGVTSASGGQSAGFRVPVPLLAYQIDGRMAKDVFITGFMRPFFISTGDFKGGMNQFGLNVEWFPSRHVGLSLGLERTLIDVREVKTANLEANFRYNISGLNASAVFRF